jgi:hypothetical protein
LKGTCVEGSSPRKVACIRALHMVKEERVGVRAGLLQSEVWRERAACERAGNPTSRVTHESGMAYPHESGMAYPHESGMAYPHESGMAYPHESGMAYPPMPCRQREIVAKRCRGGAGLACVGLALRASRAAPRASRVPHCAHRVRDSVRAREAVRKGTFPVSIC